MMKFAANRIVLFILFNRSLFQLKFSYQYLISDFQKNVIRNEKKIIFSKIEVQFNIKNENNNEF